MNMNRCDRHNQILMPCKYCMVERERDEARAALEEALKERDAAVASLEASLVREASFALNLFEARVGLEEAQARITAAVDVLSAPPVLNWQPYATKIRDALAILEGAGN